SYAVLFGDDHLADPRLLLAGTGSHEPEDGDKGERERSSPEAAKHGFTPVINVDRAAPYGSESPRPCTRGRGVGERGCLLAQEPPSLRPLSPCTQGERGERSLSPLYSVRIG